MALAASLAPGLPLAQVFAQRVALEVRPRAGDTMQVALDHRVTIVGGPRDARDSAVTIRSSYRIATRDVVERADPYGTTILVIVDSVGVEMLGASDGSAVPGLDRGLEGTRIRLRIALDGAAQLIGAVSKHDRDLAGFLATMPAVLPQIPVAVGESWVRDVPLPDDPSGDGAVRGTMRATFRLDSLSARAERAWISVRGRIESLAALANSAGAPAVSGTLTGALVLDRRRGWLVEALVEVAMESVIMAAGSGAPLLVRVHVHQALRTAPARR